MLKSLVAAAVLSLGVASPALCATITNVAPDLATLAPSSVTLPIGSSWIVPPDQVSGTNGIARSPFEDLGAGNYDSIPYFSVGNNHGPALAQLLLSSAQNTLSFLWGSPDDYNFVTLINRALTMGDPNFALVVGLNDLTNPPLGGSATFVSIAGFTFDKVEFYSGAVSFEFANITTTAPAPVPLPAGGLLLVGALGGLAALRRRKVV